MAQQYPPQNSQVNTAHPTQTHSPQGFQGYASHPTQHYPPPNQQVHILPPAPQYTQLGQPQYVQPGQQYVQGGYVHVVQNKSNALGVTALVLGSIALIGSWIPFINIFSLAIAVLAFGFGIAGIIFGAVKKRLVGTSIAGLILSIVATFLFIGSNILAFSILDDVANLENTPIYETIELPTIDV